MKKYSIIVVDNDEDERSFMKAAFDRTGLFDIIAEFESGDELLDDLNKDTATLPDLILSDLNMPGKNGFDIIEEVKGNTKLAHIPVIITSTSSTKTIVDKCLSIGAALYVIKPVTFIEYDAFVKNLYEQVNDSHVAP